MKTLIYLTFIVLLAFSCTRKNNTSEKIAIKNTKNQLDISDIEGTKWEYVLNSTCISFYLFQENNKYYFYSCEREDTLFGDYCIREDTLLLKQIGSVFDKLYQKGSSQIIGKAKYKLVYKDGYLKPVEKIDFIGEEWIKSDFKFDKNYMFKESD